MHVRFAIARTKKGRPSPERLCSQAPNLAVAAVVVRAGPLVLLAYAVQTILEVGLVAGVEASVAVALEARRLAADLARLA